MQEHQIIGISGVFVLIFCLIALYHFIGKISRHDRRYGAQIQPASRPEASQPEQDRRADRGSRGSSVKDDAWLLWNPEFHERAGSVNARFHGHREARNIWPRA